MKRFFTLTVLAVFMISAAVAQNVLTPSDLLGLKYVGGAKLSPDASKVIYTVYTPRTPNERPGGSHAVTYLKDLKSGEEKPLFEDGFKASSVNFTPDGMHISFLHRQKEGKVQVYTKPLDGGEMTQVTHSDNSISQYAWNPAGGGMAVIIREAMTPREKDLKERGYGFIFFGVSSPVFS